jgi:hypothetical protein
MSWHHSAVTLAVEVVPDEQECFALCLQATPKHPYRGNFQPSIQIGKGIEDYMSYQKFIYTQDLCEEK